MESRYSEPQAQDFIARYAGTHNADIALRVYTSRLIGADPALVLHGGGNTSVKTRLRDDTGEEIDVLCVKGSGADLAGVEPAGLPALRLLPLLALRRLPALSDEAMVNAQRTRMLDAGGPNPSVETLLHAFLPHKFIDHSHADAILSLVDQPGAEALCRERFGQRFGVVPYVMPGFALAKLAAELYERDPSVQGLLLLQHGLFTFGDTAKQSYERHIAAVHAAEEFASKRRYWSTRASIPPVSPVSFTDLGPLLRGLLGERERRYHLHLRQSAEIHDFVSDPKLDALCHVGCATPDHVIRTKRFPLLLRLDLGRSVQAQHDAIAASLDAYRSAYGAYVQRQIARKKTAVKPIDPDPRVVLVPGLGVIGVGGNDKAARIAADIYQHTISVIRGAEAIGHYQVLSEDDLFDMEYWSLEQAKLGKAAPRALDGRIVCITGAANGIGAATARTFARHGATLHLCDRDEAALVQLAEELRCSHTVLDVTDEAAVRGMVDHAVQLYGGLDGVVSNAGTAPQGRIGEVSTAEFERSFRVNFYAHQWLASAATQVFLQQRMGGFLLFNASKAAWNPGADFGPYALPKAALLALMKQYALEYGKDGVRSNAVNADRIRTRLLNQDTLAERARARGLSPDAYYTANLLGREVTGDDVADAFLTLATAQSTTGSVITVDGGNIAASPR